MCFGVSQGRGNMENMASISSYLAPSLHDFEKLSFHTEFEGFLLLFSLSIRILFRYDKIYSIYWILNDILHIMVEKTPMLVSLSFITHYLQKQQKSFNFHCKIAVFQNL